MQGLILTIARGKPGTLHTSDYRLGSISCVSATTCYAAGDITLETVTGGVASDPQPFPGPYGLGWTGIECHGGNCEARVARTSARVRSVLVSLTDGTAGSPVNRVPALATYGHRHARRQGFIAIGGPATAEPGTVVIVG